MNNSPFGRRPQTRIAPPVPAMPGMYPQMQHRPNYQLLGDAGSSMGLGGIYTITQDKKTEEFSLDYTEDRYKTPDKIYGNIQWHIDYYWAGFVNMNYVSGLLLTGSPGAGKTEISRALCNKAIDAGLRVIVITNIKYSPELIAFLDKQDDTLMFFDEFGKVFNYHTQGKMLTLLSNTFGRRRICIIADNDINGISDAIKNRPGRLRYSKDMIKLDPSVLEDYLKHNPVKPDFKISLMALYRKSLVFIYDHLQALVSEHHFMPDLPFKDILGVLNLSGFEGKAKFILSEVIKLAENGDETLIDELAISSVPNILYKDRVNEDYIYEVNIKDLNYKPEDDTQAPPAFLGGGVEALPKGVLAKVDCSITNLLSSEPKSMVFKTDGYKVTYTLSDDPGIKDDGKNNYRQRYTRS